MYCATCKYYENGNCFLPKEKKIDDPLKTQIGGDHYKHFKIQPIDFFIANNILYAEAAIIKYVLRYKEKNGREDLEKAKHLIDILINNLDSPGQDKCHLD